MTMPLLCTDYVLADLKIKDLSLKGLIWDILLNAKSNMKLRKIEIKFLWKFPINIKLYILSKIQFRKRNFYNKEVLDKNNLNK